MTVSTLVILGLAVVWAVVLLPEAIRKLRTVRSSDSIASIQSQPVPPRAGQPARRVPLDRQQRRGPAQPSPPPGPDRRPRGDLARSAPPPAGGARPVWWPPLSSRCCARSRFGGVFLIPHLVADVLLVAYVLCLHQVTATAAAPSHASNGAHVGPGSAMSRSATSRWAMSRWAMSRGDATPAPRRQLSLGRSTGSVGPRRRVTERPRSILTLLAVPLH